MATTKNGKKKPTSKKGSKSKKSSKKNNSGNVFAKLLLFVMVLAAVAYGVSFFSKDIKSKFKQVKNHEELTVKDDIAETETDDDKAAITSPAKKQDDTKHNEEAKKPETKKETAGKAEPETKTPDTGQNKPAKKEQSELIDLKKEFKENQTLNGCWLSSEQGASLTFDGQGYRIDFFGVDASEPLTGKYSAENNQIIFMTGNGDCKGIEGVYRISFDKKNIRLNCKDDNCKERKNILETDWEWIEI